MRLSDEDDDNEDGEEEDDDEDGKLISSVLECANRCRW